MRSDPLPPLASHPGTPGRDAFGGMRAASGDAPALLGVLGATGCRLLGDGALGWDPTAADMLFGPASLGVPQTLGQLDALTDGAATLALATGERMLCRIGGRVEVRADRSSGLIALRRLDDGLRGAAASDPEAIALAAALVEGRMRLYRQPIVAANDEAVVRWECLARMIRQDGTIASPYEFIPAAERAGLIGALDIAALGLALDALCERPAEALAVNVSAATLADQGAREDYVGRLRSAKRGAGGLTVEITETIAIHDLDVAARFAEQVRTPGVRLALDDFGEGYTSFQSLMKLPLDEVKIDGLYVQDIDVRADSQAFVRAIEGLSRDLGLETVAERVETGAEARALRNIGVKGLQGFYFGAPAAA
jgi:EAL domain-containing protein (putative c-di-GMP-specific phosphodiesterase class I)